MQNARFPSKITLFLKKVCRKPEAKRQSIGGKQRRATVK